MWTSFLSLLGVAVGGGITYLSSVATWKRQRADRQEERLAGLVDQHRKDLKAAYAGFLGALSAYLSVADWWVSTATVIQQQKRDAFERLLADHDHDSAEAIAEQAANPSLVENSRQALEGLRRTANDADTKLAEVMLLEDRAKARLALDALLDPPLNLPQSVDEYTRFRSAIKLKQEKLDAFAKELGGAFAPKQWAESQSENSALALSAGSGKP